MHVLQDDDTYFFSSVLKLNDFYEKNLPIPLVKVTNKIFYLVLIKKTKIVVFLSMILF